MAQKDSREEQASRQDTSTGTQKSSDLKVEISQYQTLLTILDSPKKTAKVILAMIVFAMAFFIALAFVTITIKRFYPYNEIKTNAFGATTMQNEEVELTYWLFNTADLWANSGIRVECGDVVTIRASGKSNTSLHHLVDNAFYNAIPLYEWVGTEGQPRQENTRTAFKIYSERDPDALIMQVIPERSRYASNENREELKEQYLRPDYISVREKCDTTPESRFYFIGKERVNLRINQEGTLHFAVNDIVLTRPCIAAMTEKNNQVFLALRDTAGYCKLLATEGDTTRLNRLRPNWKSDKTLHDLWQVCNSLVTLRKECNQIKELYQLVKNNKQYSNTNSNYEALLIKFIYLHRDSITRYTPGKDALAMQENLQREDSCQKGFLGFCERLYAGKRTKIENYLENPVLADLCDQWRETNRIGLHFGPHPVPLNSKIDEGREYTSPMTMSDEDMQKTIYPFYNEMTYYRDNNYYKAWYDDNIGTFLIVVEKRKK